MGDLSTLQQSYRDKHRIHEVGIHGPLVAYKDIKLTESFRLVIGMRLMFLLLYSVPRLQ